MEGLKNLCMEEFPFLLIKVIERVDDTEIIELLSREFGDLKGMISFL